MKLHQCVHGVGPCAICGVGPAFDLQAENKRLREALFKYGHHLLSCAKMNPNTLPAHEDCTCGLTAVRLQQFDGLVAPPKEAG